MSSSPAADISNSMRPYKAIGEQRFCAFRATLPNWPILIGLYETVAEAEGDESILFSPTRALANLFPFGSVTEEHFDKLFNINVKGNALHGAKGPTITGWTGSIILNGSVDSFKTGTAAFGVYRRDQGRNPLFRANLHYRSQGPSHPRKRRKSGPITLGLP